MSRWLKRFKQEREVSHAPGRAEHLPAPLYKTHLDESQFGIVKLAHHGLPRNPCTLAFDPHRRLLCVGTALGQFKIIGQPGVELLVSSSSAAAITFAFFHSAAGLLITITADSVIEKWSLRDFETEALATECQGSRKFSSKITAAHHRGGDSAYLYLGTSGGILHVLDIDELAITPYTITTDDVVASGPGFKVKADIVGIDSHPYKPSRLLIGYATGLVIMWDLKDREVHRRFQFVFAKNLRCLTWAPWGTFFACGYENGQVCIWDDKKGDEPFHRQYQSDGKHVVRRPITKIIWTGVEGDQSSRVSKSTANSPGGKLFICGGTEETNPDGILMWEGQMFEHKSMLVDHSVVDIVPLYPSPQMRGSQNAPTHLVSLAESSHPVACFFSMENPSAPFTSLPCAQHQTSTVTVTEVFNHPHTVAHVQRACVLARSHPYTPVNGGAPPNSTAADVARSILILGHSDGRVTIMEERNRAAAHNLVTISLQDLLQTPMTEPSVTAIHLYIDSNGERGKLLVGTASGAVFYFALTNAGNGPELVSILRDDHRARITSLLYAYSADAVVVGDAQGTLSITDGTSLSTLMHKDLQPRKKTNRFAVTALHMTPPFPGARKEDLVLLFVGTSDEQLILINVKSLQILKALQLGEPKDRFSEVLAIHAVDWLGRALVPVAAPEESDDEDGFHIVDEENDPSCCLLLVSTAYRLHLLLLPACTMVRVITWETPVVKAFLTTCEDEAVLLVVDEDLAATAFALMDLKPVYRATLADYGIGATSRLLAATACTPDGCLYFPSSVAEIMSVSIVASAADVYYPIRRVTFFDDELVYPEKKPIKTLFGKSRRDSDAVLGGLFTGDFLTTVVARDDGLLTPEKSMRIRGKTVSTHDDDLAELLETGAGPSRIRSRTVNPHMRDATESMNRAISAAGQAREGLEERGEKLNTLAERVTEMAIAAEQFSSNASQLKKSQR